MGIHNIVFMLIICISTHLVYGYKGKVFDSTPKVRDNAELTMEINLNEYLSRMDSQDEVVVFPEYGLTSLDVFSKENLTKYGLEIPAVNASVNICAQDTKSKIISALSCAALEKGIYLLANVIEVEKKDFYNTNLVFNKTGALIAKYRKINLFGDEIAHLKAGKEIVTFDTEYGTFGTFTCFDILNKRPALDILAQENVTNILYPTSWFSTSPFWASLSVQDGYAKRTGVNLLASSYNAPRNSNGGAGIYQGRQAKDVHIQGFSGIAAIVSDIGRAQKGRPECTTMDTGNTLADTRGLINNDIANLFVMGNSFVDNSNSFTHEALSMDVKDFETKLCSPDNGLCCKFSAKIFNSFIQKDPKYKFVVYSKNFEYACGLVSCSSDDITSCGKPMVGSKDNTFSLLKVQALRTDLQAYDIPSTLNYDLKPVDIYKYCSVPGNVTVELQNVGSLVAFGVLFSDASNIHSLLYITIISTIVSRIF